MYKWKKTVLLIIIIKLTFLFGCMGNTTVGIDEKQNQTDKPGNGNLFGKILFEERDIDPLGTEIYFYKLFEQETNTSGTDEINLTDEEEEDNSSNILRAAENDYDFKAIADNEGNFAVENIESGFYKITALKDGYSIKTVDKIKVVQDEDNKIEITMSKPGEITGKITFKDGNTEYGLSVNIGSQKALTDEEGSFNSQLAPGTYEVVVDEFGYDRIIRQVQIESDKILDIGTLTLEKTYVNPEMAMLSAKALSVFGYPVKKADVILFNEDEKYFEKTDDTGFFRFLNINPGSYILKIVADNFGVKLQTDIEKGEIYKLDNLIVDNISRYGQVSFEPNLEGEVEFEPDFNIKNTNGNRVIYVLEETNSGYNIKGIEPGIYNINISSQRYQDREFEVEVKKGQKESKTPTFLLRRSSIKGRVVSNDNGVKADINFNSNSVTSNTNGEFSLENIESDVYTVEVKKFGYKKFLDSVFVENGANIEDFEINLIEEENDGPFANTNIESRINMIAQTDTNILMRNENKNKIYSMDKESLEIETVIDYNGEISDFSVDGNSLYIVDGLNNYLLKYSLANFIKLDQVNVGIEPFIVKSKGDEIFVLSKGDETLFIAEKDDLSVNSFPLGFVPSDFVITEDNVFISDRLGDRIKIFNLNNKTLSSTIDGINRPKRIYKGEGVIYIVKQSSNEVEVIDYNTHKRESVLNPGIKPENVYESNKRVYITGDNKIAVYYNSEFNLDKVLSVSPDLGGTVEDNNNSERLFVWQKFQSEIITYFNKRK
ncbi:MAG: hypothetical protein ACQESP_08915 [Candidatus Muiribacteriota bacterium]